MSESLRRVCATAVDTDPEGSEKCSGVNHARAVSECFRFSSATHSARDACLALVHACACLDKSSIFSLKIPGPVISAVLSDCQGAAKALTEAAAESHTSSLGAALLLWRISQTLDAKRVVAQAAWSMLLPSLKGSLSQWSARDFRVAAWPDDGTVFEDEDVRGSWKSVTVEDKNIKVSKADKKLYGADAAGARSRSKKTEYTKSAAELADIAKRTASEKRFEMPSKLMYAL